MYQKVGVKISLIIPVYNVEEYIEQCLQSAVDQTLSSKYFEVIIVDDCSTDSSSRKIKKFVKKYSHLRCVRNDRNLGLGMSRNKGIEFAKGEFVFFLDGDDYLDPRTLEDLLMTAFIENADIVSCGFRRVEEDGSLVYKKNAYYRLGLRKIEILKKLLAHKIPSMSCARLIRKSLFIDNNLCFPEGLHEDVPVVYKLFVFAGKTCGVEGCYYNWVLRKGSITSHITSRHIEDLAKFLSEKSTFLKEYYGEGFYTENLEKFNKEGWSKTFNDKLKQIYSDCNLEYRDRIDLIKYLYSSLSSNEEFLSSIFINRRKYQDIFIFFEIPKISGIDSLDNKFSFYLQKPEKNKVLLFNRSSSSLVILIKRKIFFFYKIIIFLKKSFLKRNFFLNSLKKAFKDVYNKIVLLRNRIFVKKRKPFREEIVFIFETEGEESLFQEVSPILKSLNINAKLLRTGCCTEEEFLIRAKGIKGVVFFGGKSCWDQNIMVEMRYLKKPVLIVLSENFELKKKREGFLSSISYWKIPTKSFLIEEKQKVSLFVDFIAKAI